MCFLQRSTDEAGLLYFLECHGSGDAAENIGLQIKAGDNSGKARWAPPAVNSHIYGSTLNYRHIPPSCFSWCALSLAIRAFM